MTDIARPPATTLRGRLHEQDGVTLVEMMVSTLLIGVVGAIVFSGILAMTRAVAVADTVSFDQGFARNALTLLSRDVRAASAVQLNSQPAFRVAGPRTASFTANLTSDRRQSLIDITIDGADRLVVTSIESDPASTAPNLVYDPADAIERYIAGSLVNTGPILEYFDTDGTALDAFDGSGNLSQADRALIATVRITLDLNRSPLQANSTRVTTTVRLPNGGAGR